MDLDNVVITMHGVPISHGASITYEGKAGDVVLTQGEGSAIHIEHNYSKEQMIELLKELSKIGDLIITVDSEELSMAQAIAMIGNKT